MTWPCMATWLFHTAGRSSKAASRGQNGSATPTGGAPGEDSLVRPVSADSAESADRLAFSP
eukprot:350064-Chlamydomonas_euryale.AAC.3